MFSQEILKKIKRIHIRSNRIVNSMMSGQYKSVFRGSGVEFEEVRDYMPGDEIKNIDWKVSARMGRPFIKLYREERELVVILLIDMSASTKFGTTSKLKTEAAAEIASILAFNAIRNNDKVGAILFTDKIEKYIPPKKGSSHVWRVIKEIFTFKPENKKTDISSAAKYLGMVARKKTISFLISDFLTPITNDYVKQLKVVSKKHELIAVLLSDPGEFVLPKSGMLFLRDFETQEISLIDASCKKTQKQYRLNKKQNFNSILHMLKSSDIDCIQINTKDSVVDPLVKYFRLREKRFK